MKVDIMVARTLSFRTAVSMDDFTGMDGHNRNLQYILDNLHQRYTTVGERQVEIDGQVLQVRNLETRDGSSMIHLVAYTPDDEIAVVPDADDVETADLILAEAPDETEFLDGEIMFLINGNDVGICRCGIGEGKLYLYVEELARRAGYDTANLAFRLYPRADVDKMAQVMREGVHRLSMNAIANEISINEADTAVESLLSSTLRELGALIGFEPQEAQDIENLKVGVSFDFNKINGTAIDQQSLTTLAQRILDEDEHGFVIETLEGNRFKADDVLLMRRVNFEAFGKSIYFRRAWDQLVIFYGTLTRRAEM